MVVQGQHLHRASKARQGKARNIVTSPLKMVVFGINMHSLEDDEAFFPPGPLVMDDSFHAVGGIMISR